MKKYRVNVRTQHALNLFFTAPTSKQNVFYFYVNKLFFHSFMSADLKTTIKHFMCAVREVA